MISTINDINRLIELAIVQRSEIKRLVDSLPELRTHLSIEIEKNVEQIEPYLRAELELFLSERAKDENVKLGKLLQSKIETLCDDIEKTAAAKHSELLQYKEKVIELEKIAEKKITEAGERIGIEVPAQVEKLVEEKFARFPRAGEIDQLRKEFAEPKGLNPRGKWESGVTYYKLDLVAYNGDSYVANEQTTQKPSRNSTKWTLNSARGAAGSGNNVSLAELTGVPANGQILIGSNGGYVNADLTAGSGITIDTSAGFIEISSTGGGGGLVYKGSWNASTNSPTLASSVGTNGDYYIVSVSGSTNLNGITDWQIGDWAIYNGTVWQKIDNSDSVSSVFGRTGVVTATIGDYTASQITNVPTGNIASNNVQDAINELSADITAAQNVLDAYITNDESVAITKGQVVYAYGATGNRMSVKLASNSAESTSAKTIGVVLDASIAAGAAGYIRISGVIDGLNLGSFTAGQTVYLSSTAGAFTATKPSAPNHLVYIGIIERANNGNGQLYVKVQNGYELNEIHDVQILTAPSAGAMLVYDATNSLWKAARLNAGSNINIANADASVTISITGTIPVANGGTGQTSYTDGQLLIGNTSTGGLSKATLTAGSNVTITNAGGAITIAATGGGGSSTVVVNAPLTNSGTSTNANLSVSTATTSSTGVVQLNNTITSNSTSNAATANSVRTAYQTNLALTVALS